MTLGRRDFSDEERAHALAVLASNGGNAKRTARQLGIPRSTIRGWSGALEKGPAGHQQRVPAHVGGELVQQASDGLAEKFRQVAHLMTESVLGNPEKIEKAGVRDLLIAAGIATEKALLLTGGATSRTESIRISLIAPHALRDGMTVIDVPARILSVDSEHS